MLGLVDFHIERAQNGWWYIHRMEHQNTSPGDNSPNDGGIVGEWKTRENAIWQAKEDAQHVIDSKQAKQVAIFVNGDEILFIITATSIS